MDMESESTTQRRNASPIRINKGHIVLAAIIIIVIALIIIISGGSKLKGTYAATDWSGQTFTFSGNKITMSAFGMSTSGTYKIHGDKIEVHYSMFGEDYEWEVDYAKKGKSIFIAGTEFVKQ